MKMPAKSVDELEKLKKKLEFRKNQFRGKATNQKEGWGTSGLRALGAASLNGIFDAAGWHPLGGDAYDPRPRIPKSSLSGSVIL